MVHIQWLWMTPVPDFQVTLTQKQYEIETELQWNANRNLQIPYWSVSFWMILSDLSDWEKYSMTRSIARLVCDSGVSCINLSQRVGSHLLPPVTPDGRVLFLGRHMWVCPWFCLSVCLSVRRFVCQNGPTYFKLDISRLVSNWTVASRPTHTEMIY